MGVKQFLSGIFVIIFIGVVITKLVQGGPTAAAGNTSNASLTASAPTEPSPADGPHTVITVGTRRLWSDYEENEVAADGKYRGQLLLVGGRVESIDRDAFDALHVNLASPGFLPVGSTLADGQREGAAALSRGDYVFLLCKDVQRIMGSPTLSDCAITSPATIDARTKEMLMNGQL